MNSDEMRRFYPTGATIAHLLVGDVQFGSAAIDRYCTRPMPVRARSPLDRRAYDRTTRKNWAGRKKMAGTRIA